MKSKTQATIDGLIAMGWTEIEGRSTLSKTFVHSDFEYKMFVGRGGSLRIGKMKTKSRSMTDSPYHKKVLVRGL